MDKFVLDALKICFENEISNAISYGANEIVVSFDDGTKAKITIKKTA